MGLAIFFCFLDNDTDGLLSALRLLLSLDMASSVCDAGESPTDVGIGRSSPPLPVSVLLLVEDGASAAAGGVRLSWRTASPTDVVA